MRSILIYLILLGTCVYVNAQSLALTFSGEQMQISNTGKLSLTYLEPEEFQLLDWKPGYAYYQDGSSRQFDGLKYDPALDLIQVNAGGNVLTLLPGVINGVSMESSEHVTAIFVKVPLKKAVFMEVLSAGNLNLLLYRKVKGEAPEIDISTSTVRFEKEVEIIEFEEVLYTWGAEGIDKFKPSKKALLDLMGDHAEEVEAFLDKNSIRPKVVSSLMLAFDYYNQL